MTEERKEQMRELIQKEGWNRYGQIDPSPTPLIWNKEVEILYEDMDGYPCRCRAVYEHHSFGKDYFRAMDGPAKGNKMCMVFAWRSIEGVTGL